MTSFPLSRVPDPSTAPPLRWGVLAPGGIAAKFTAALQKHTRQQVVAVGSRSRSRAEEFARRFGIERAHGSYEALVADAGVDVVYVASPTGQHLEHALLALAAGRPVLVEKSLAVDAGQVRQMQAAARAAGVLLVEAMWSRFLPHYDVVEQIVRAGILGPVETVLADHGQRITADMAPRLHDPALGGGAMLDLGVYPVAFADLVLGRPEHVVAVGEWTESGVDAQISAVLRSGTAHALVSTTMNAATPTTASVSGPDGLLQLAGDFYVPTVLTLTTAAGREQRPADPVTGHEGLCFQAAHVARLVADGVLDSPVLPGATSLAMMETMDEIRRQTRGRTP